jgi:hypothetical protein
MCNFECNFTQVDAVARPGSAATRYSSNSGTYISRAERCLNTELVPANESQTAAVMGLRGGLELIHGIY